MTMTEQQPQTKGPRALTRYEEAGVPAEWLNDKGRFRGPGLDARYKSQLVNAALDHEEANRGRKGSPAHKMLDRLGWTAHLDKSRESRKAKAAKKAAKPTKADRERFAAEEASRAEPSQPTKPE